MWGIFNFWFLLLGIFEVSCLFFVGCWKCSFQTISLTWLTWYCWFVTKDSNNYYLYNRIGNNSEFQFFREVKFYNIPTFKDTFSWVFVLCFSWKGGRKQVRNVIPHTWGGGVERSVSLSSLPPSPNELFFCSFMGGKGKIWRDLFHVVSLWLKLTQPLGEISQWNRCCVLQMNYEFQPLKRSV